jgi:hypothetical protein
MSHRALYLSVAAGLLAFCAAAAPDGITTVETVITARERLNMPQIWALEFAYRHPRMVSVEIPDENGRPQRKLVWYLPYRITNRGDTERMFVPEFVLETDTGQRYPDRVVPLAMRAIRAREGSEHTWHDSTTVAGRVPPSPQEGADRSVYGVATWYDVDPRTDYFSIFVNGLSNGYRMETTDDGQQRMVHKTLELKFWRPGDEFYEHEKEIQFVESVWVYR